MRALLFLTLVGAVSVEGFFSGLRSTGTDDKAAAKAQKKADKAQKKADKQAAKQAAKEQKKAEKAEKKALKKAEKEKKKAEKAQKKAAKQAAKAQKKADKEEKQQEKDAAKEPDATPAKVACKTNADCAKGFQCFEVAKGIFFTDADSCNGYAGGCHCRDVDPYSGAPATATECQECLFAYPVNNKYFPEMCCWGSTGACRLEKQCAGHKSPAKDFADDAAIAIGKDTTFGGAIFGNQENTFTGGAKHPGNNFAHPTAGFLSGSAGLV